MFGACRAIHPISLLARPSASLPEEGGFSFGPLNVKTRESLDFDVFLLGQANLYHMADFNIVVADPESGTRISERRTDRTQTDSWGERSETKLREALSDSMGIHSLSRAAPMIPAARCARTCLAPT
ncbi:MAG: hypothetical protein A07HR60_01285 [uncultured archaeon A07HR60]|nr:MAG: hypothetical protein A07HR60_01285 [uncultured archaeon A07HR60]